MLKMTDCSDPNESFELIKEACSMLKKFSKANTAQNVSDDQSFEGLIWTQSEFQGQFSQRLLADLLMC